MIEPLTLTFPMYGGAKTRQIQLLDILESFDDDDLTWVMKFFDGISREDSQLNVLELEERITNSRGEGIRLSNEELLSLARKTDQVIDCEILGFKNASSQIGREEPVVTIEAFDSTEWTVVLDQAVVQTSLL